MGGGQCRRQLRGVSGVLFCDSEPARNNRQDIAEIMGDATRHLSQRADFLDGARTSSTGQVS
jgi:hypothetical protein